MMLSFTSAAPVSAAEQKVRVGFYSGDWNLTFDGTVKPDGPTRYTYDGYLYADCPPGRFPAPRIALGHGAVSRGWQWEYDYCRTVQTHVWGEGERGAGDSVEFKVGANSGLAGVWQYGDSEAYDIGS
ncbi:hypothetical protein [Streptomyces pharetrae]|uniref:hypothetical protein n=1 Tax=Streptomyces pharetrae TaxID=291370 RepID=UPI00117C8931